MNRLAALASGAFLLAGGLALMRTSRFAAPKGALFVAVGIVLLVVAAWPTRRPRV